MRAHVALEHAQIALGGFAGLKARGQHPTGGIIDEGDQAALGRAALEPVVVAAIDLHQLAQAGAACARAVHSLGAAALGRPQAGLDHPAAQGLGAVREAVFACQVFARQLGAEVAVALAQQLQRGLAHGIGDLAVAGPPAPLGDQAGIAFGAHAAAQPLDLTLR
ncbi:hypothetical protein MASR1M50_25970 [Burkholderiales bacterium]